MFKAKSMPTITNPNEKEIESAEALLLLQQSVVIHGRPEDMGGHGKEIQIKYSLPTEGPRSRHQNQLRVYQRRGRRPPSGQPKPNQVEERRAIPDLNLPCASQGTE